MLTLIDKKTIQKFDVPGPRYTSYPTAPVWNNDLTERNYRQALTRFGKTEKTLSLYIHLPFCESLCNFCACNVLIRPKDRKYADEYLSYLFKEIEMVADAIGARQTIRQLHWGGGTPNFLTNDQAGSLYDKITEHFDVDPNGEIAIEIEPRTVSLEHIRLLRKLGFNRLSMGVQDFYPKVQEAINRVQPFEFVKKCTEEGRRLGFNSINFDLIYGLPHQTIDSFNDTIEKVNSLRPDRIALYSFAHVPWLKKHQQKMDPATFPNPDEKLDIFLKSREQLLDAGYVSIAMDHFALKEDELAQAFDEEKLYRNFMGYTVKPADEFIGLGLTSIGFIEKTFIQNHKVLKDYYQMIEQGMLPMDRGKELSRDDEIRQYTIHSLMCHFKLDKELFFRRFTLAFDLYFVEEKEHIQKCIEDGLLEKENGVITVTELGKIFIRNICMGFDYYLQSSKGEGKFSRTV